MGGKHVTKFVSSYIQELIQGIIEQTSPLFYINTNDAKTLVANLQMCSDVLNLYGLFIAEAWFVFVFVSIK